MVEMFYSEDTSCQSELIKKNSTHKLFVGERSRILRTRKFESKKKENSQVNINFKKPKYLYYY